MKIYSNLEERVVVQSSKIEWIPSPTSGISRRILERDGNEVARATTIVRFDPQRKFPEHTHYGGEEFFILEGIFSDASGDYTKGTYVRNPINSIHSPWSDPGCIALVKLYQMTDESESKVIVNTNDGSLDWISLRTETGSIKRLILHQNSKTGELVYYEKWEKIKLV